MAAAPGPGASAAKTSRRIVRCPACGGESVYGPENAWRPFCSERCRSIDFGAWASERYCVAAAAPKELGDADFGADDGNPPRP